jgi:cytochrome P450
MGTYVLAMVMHPEVQRKAQEEVDRVIGKDRLPRADDLDKLPYLDAVLKEVMRWHTVACISTCAQLHFD